MTLQAIEAVPITQPVTTQNAIASISMPITVDTNGVADGHVLSASSNGAVWTEPASDPFGRRVVYRALLTQYGEDDPTVTELVNNLGASLTITRDMDGSYLVNSNKPVFTVDRTVVTFPTSSNEVSSTTNISFGSSALDLQAIALFTELGGQRTDGLMYNGPLTIEVYPF